MDLQAEKLKLVQAVLDIEDIGVLKKVRKLLKKQGHDWFDDLTDEQQQSIMRGIKQADMGDVIPHAEAMKRLGL